MAGDQFWPGGGGGAHHRFANARGQLVSGAVAQRQRFPFGENCLRPVGGNERGRHAADQWRSRGRFHCRRTGSQPVRHRPARRADGEPHVLPGCWLPGTIVHRSHQPLPGLWGRTDRPVPYDICARDQVRVGPLQYSYPANELRFHSLRAERRGTAGQWQPGANRGGAGRRITSQGHRPSTGRRCISGLRLRPG